MNDTKFAINNYDNVTVSCSSSQWHDHIIYEHAVMEKNETAVKDTIKDPDSVYKSSQNDNREVYFKQSSNSTYKHLTKVIVEYSESKKGNLKGEVVTAFPAPAEKGGIGDVIYKKSKS